MYESDPIQSLTDVDYSRAETFGERACSLSRLISKGYNVPIGVVISTKVFKRFLNIMPGARRIDHLFASVTPENAEEVAKEIQEIILNFPVPMPIANSIADEITKLMDNITSETVVIRTSAHVEDSSRHVCLGRGVYFHLKEIRDIFHIMKNCWASAFTADVLYDLMQAGLPPDTVRIAVIVEEMVSAKVSGILSVNKAPKPQNGGIYIRSNWGSDVGKNGLCCDHIVVDEAKIGEPIETFTSYKEKVSHIPPDHRHPVIADNPPEKKQELSLSPQNINTLIQLAKKVRRDFETDYEIEFVFDHNDALWLLDAIPRTALRGYHRIGTTVKNSELSKE
ncbi:MAG: PEP/pyruvate-binding domain-containing protein [Candidatus Hodarchaeales archaeon]|jgi:pyruvate,water dikinase